MKGFTARCSLPSLKTLLRKQSAPNKVFYAYFLNVTDPSSYVGAWKGLMKDLKAEGIAPTGYGLREIVAGGENNETHMIWMGYPSMEALMDSYEKTSTSKSVLLHFEKAKKALLARLSLHSSQLILQRCFSGACGTKTEITRVFLKT